MPNSLGKSFKKCICCFLNNLLKKSYPVKSSELIILLCHAWCVEHISQSAPNKSTLNQKSNKIWCISQQARWLLQHAGTKSTGCICAISRQTSTRVACPFDNLSAGNWKQLSLPYWLQWGGHSVWIADGDIKQSHEVSVWWGSDWCLWQCHHSLTIRQPTWCF